jgi:hypothetical protein
MEDLRPNRARERSIIYALLTLALLLGAIPAHRSAWQGTAELHTLLLRPPMGSISLLWESSRV